jgi:hypothetical protein
MMPVRVKAEPFERVTKTMAVAREGLFHSKKARMKKPIRSRRLQTERKSYLEINLRR